MAEKKWWISILFKFYTNQWSTSPYDQVFVDDIVEIENNIRTFGIATTTIPLIEWLQEDNKVEIYKVPTSWTEQRIFIWFIYELEPFWKDFGKVKITLRSEKAIFDKRVFFEPINFYDVDFKTSSKPTYASSPGILPGTKYLIGSTIWINEGVNIPEPPTSPNYIRKAISLVDTSYVYVDDTWVLYKYTSSLISLWVKSGLTVSEYIQEMLDDYNDNYWENWTLDTDISETIRTNREKWDNYADIMDELSDTFGYYWDIRDWKVIFKSILWKDKTSWIDYQELFFDGNNQTGSNISNIRLVGNANRSNLFVYRWQTGKIKVDDSNYTDFVYWAEYKIFRDWNLDKKISKYKEQVNRYLRSYEISVEQNTIEASIWDKIKLIVQNTNDFFDIDTEVQVISKKTIIDKWEQNTFQLEEFKTFSFTEEIFWRNIVKSIKFNQLSI